MSGVWDPVVQRKHKKILIISETIPSLKKPFQLLSITSFLGSFELQVDPGQFTDSEIVVMLGENGTGKTTFIRMLAGKLTPDEGGRFSYCNENIVIKNKNSDF